MPKYDIIHPVEHDGIRYADGKIELTAKQAAPLLAVGSIAAPAAAKTAPAAADTEAENGES